MKQPRRLWELALLLALLFLFLSLACRQPAPPTTPTPSPTPTPFLAVHFVDVGQGDAIWVQTWEGKSLVIDGGRRRSPLGSYLKKNGVKEVEAVVGTNPDADHIGGLIELLGSFKVSQVWLSGQEHTTQTFEDFVDAIARSGAKVNRARRGDKLPLGSLVADVLHPVEPFFSGRNNNSVVMRLPFRDISFLFAGDAEKEAEASIIASRLPLQSTVLKLGHHGSRTSTSAPFLAAVSPQVAVYQAGKGNQFGHPHPVTLQALASAGVRTLGTDKQGTIILRTEGRSYTIQTEK